MTNEKGGKATWPIGKYLFVSICGAFIMSTPGLDRIPARTLLIQTAVFLVMMWSRLAWAIWKKEDRECYALYITLMIILPFVVHPLAGGLVAVHDFIVR